MDSYSTLLMDAMHTVPPELLGSLLQEELTEQRDRMLVSEGATGGALAFVPFSQSGSGSQRGCLLYPSGEGLDSLSILHETKVSGGIFRWLVGKLMTAASLSSGEL